MVTLSKCMCQPATRQGEIVSEQNAFLKLGNEVVYSILNAFGHKNSHFTVTYGSLLKIEGPVKLKPMN